MTVKVLLFGVLKEQFGGGERLLELPDASRISDIFDHIEGLSSDPALLQALAVAVNQEYVSRDTVLEPNDEVALLPPVSGGRG